MEQCLYMWPLSMVKPKWYVYCSKVVQKKMRTLVGCGRVMARCSFPKLPRKVIRPSSKYGKEMDGNRRVSLVDISNFYTLIESGGMSLDLRQALKSDIASRQVQR